VKPPVRLLDDPALAPELRADLERTSATSYAYDSAAGLAALHAAMGATQAASTTGAATASEAGAQAVGPGASAAAKAGGSAAGVASATAPGVQSATWFASLGGKLALAATFATVVAAGVIAWPRPAKQHVAPRPALETRPSRSAPAESAATPAPDRATAERESTAQAPSPAPDAIDAELARIRARAERAGNSDADAALRREIADLGRIKALLESDPAQAYRLAQAGHRVHRRGMLRHEREGLAVLALWNLDRRGEAEARSRAFLTRYPNSPLRAEIERRSQAAQRRSAPESR